MALKKFDIEDIRKMAIKDFEKKYLKPTRLAKCEAGLFLVKFKMNNKPSSIFIPFKKKIDAKDTIKNNVIHNAAEMAYVEMSYDKTKIEGANSKGQLTLSIKQVTGASLKRKNLIGKDAGFFENKFKIGLNVIEGTDDPNPNPNLVANVDSGTSNDVVSDKSTLEELNKAFLEGKEIYKQIGKTTDSTLKAKMVLKVWNSFEDLMPRLEEFISNSDAADTQTATKTREATKKLQDQLKPYVDKIRAKQDEKSNENLSTLTDDIIKLSITMIENFSDEIVAFDKSMDSNLMTHLEEIKTSSTLA